MASPFTGYECPPVAPHFNHYIKYKYIYIFNIFFSTEQIFKVITNQSSALHLDDFLTFHLHVF